MKSAIVVSALFLTAAANASVIYTNTTQTGSRFNPGADTSGTPIISIDDVPFSLAATGGATHVEITKVTVGLRRQGASSPAQTLNFFSASFNGNTINQPSLLGSLQIPAGTGTAFVTDIFSLGDGVNVLGTVPLDYNLLAGFGTVGVGISYTDTAAGATTGWRVTNGPDANANAFWQWLPDGAAPAGPFTFGATGPAATFYLVVEGNFVPAPGAAALLGLGGLVTLRRRR